MKNSMRYLMRRLVGLRETPTMPIADEQMPQLKTEKSAESLYCDVAMGELAMRLHDIEVIDARSSTLFTIGSTILPITASLLTTSNTALGDSVVATTALFLGFVCYLLPAAFFVWSYRINKWDSPPDLPQWKEVTVGRGEEDMQRWLGDACVEAYESNEPYVESKASKIGVALWCLAGEAGFLTIAVLAPLWPTW